MALKHNLLVSISQVTDSGSSVGNLDIIMEVWNPLNQLLYQSEKKSDDEYSTRAEMEGDYQVCLDNT